MYAPLIVTAPDAHGQPVASWRTLPTRPWDGAAELPEGEYCIEGATARRLVLPMRGRVVLHACQVGRIERFSADVGDLELVLNRCAITDQLAVEMPASLSALLINDASFARPAGPRQSYVYANARGPIYVQGLRASGGHVTDNGQHSLDLATNEGKTISVHGFEDDGGSTASINIHVKPAGLEALWVSASTLRGRTGIDCADANNSKLRRTKRVSLRGVEFDLRQHPTMPAMRYCIFPAHAIDEVWGEGVVWRDADRGWPIDAEYGSVIPRILGLLPWGPDGKPVESPAPQLPIPPAPAQPLELYLDALDAEGRRYRLKVTATPN